MLSKGRTTSEIDLMTVTNRQPPDVTVSIINADNEPVLRRCLASIPAAARDIVCEIIVVNNMCPAESIARLRRDFPQIEVVDIAGRQSFAANNNLVLRRARGRYFLLLNDDTELGPRSIDQMAAFLDAWQTVAVVGPRLVGPDGSVQTSSARPLATPLRYVAAQLHLDSMFRSRTHEAGGAGAVECISGACMMGRTDEFRNMGGLDERLDLYFEDDDLCYRLRRAGRQVFYLPDVEVMHVGGTTTRRFKAEAKIGEYRSMKLVFREHLGTSTPVLALMKLAAMMSATMRMSGFAVRAVSGPDRGTIRRYAAAYMKVLLWHCCHV